MQTWAVNLSKQIVGSYRALTSEQTSCPHWRSETLSLSSTLIYPAQSTSCCTVTLSCSLSLPYIFRGLHWCRLLLSHPLTCALGLRTHINTISSSGYWCAWFTFPWPLSLTPTMFWQELSLSLNKGAIPGWREVRNEEYVKLNLVFGCFNRKTKEEQRLNSACMHTVPFCTT